MALDQRIELPGDQPVDQSDPHAERKVPEWEEYVAEAQPETTPTLWIALRRLRLQDPRPVFATFEGVFDRLDRAFDHFADPFRDLPDRLFRTTALVEPDIDLLFMPGRSGRPHRAGLGRRWCGLRWPFDLDVVLQHMCRMKE